MLRGLDQDQARFLGNQLGTKPEMKTRYLEIQSGPRQGLGQGSD